MAMLLFLGIVSIINTTYLTSSDNNILVFLKLVDILRYIALIIPPVVLILLLVAEKLTNNMKLEEEEEEDTMDETTEL